MASHPAAIERDRALPVHRTTVTAANEGHFCLRVKSAACAVRTGNDRQVRLQSEKDRIVDDGVVGCEADGGGRQAAASCREHDAKCASEVEVGSLVHTPPNVSATSAVTVTRDKPSHFFLQYQCVTGWSKHTATRRRQRPPPPPQRPAAPRCCCCCC